MNDDWRDSILTEASGGPKAKGIATYTSLSELISTGRPPKAARPKGYEAKKRKARKQAQRSRRINRRKK